MFDMAKEGDCRGRTNAAGCGSATMEPLKRRDWEALRPSLHAKTERDDDGNHQECKKFQEVRHKVKREKGIN